MGFDPIMMALSNDYTDSKQLAKVKKTIFTWDGDTTGKTIIDGVEEDNNACKISDNLIDVEKAKLVKLRLFSDKSGMDFMELDIEDIYENKELLPLAYSVSVEGLKEIKTLLTIFYQDMEGFYKGVYFGYGDGWHVSYAEFETIHPIDPKFLPGVCLPVVELETVATAEGAVLTDEEAANMSAAVAMGTPVVVAFEADDALFSGVFSRVKHPDFMQMQYSIGTYMFVLMRVDDTGQWTFHYVAGE